MRLSWFWVGAIWVLGAPPPILAVPAPYIGAERCKLCHRAVYESWARTRHASGDSGATPRSHRGEARCATCHGTSNDVDLRVECEACHGPGGDYWPAEIMIDPDKAAMAGLVRPTESVCRRCHDNDEPGHEREFVMPPPAEWTGAIHVLTNP